MKKYTVSFMDSAVISNSASSKDEALDQFYNISKEDIIHALAINDIDVIDVLEEGEPSGITIIDVQEDDSNSLICDRESLFSNVPCFDVIFKDGEEDIVKTYTIVFTASAVTTIFANSKDEALDQFYNISKEDALNALVTNDIDVTDVLEERGCVTSGTYMTDVQAEKKITIIFFDDNYDEWD